MASCMTLGLVRSPAIKASFSRLLSTSTGTSSISSPLLAARARPLSLFSSTSLRETRRHRTTSSLFRKTQRRFYYDKNDPRIQNARPLWHVETPGRILRSPGIHTVAILAVIAALAFYFTNLETVPISGRTRFNCYSAETMRQAGKAQCEQVLAGIQHQGGGLLSDWDSRTQRVKRVMSKLIPFSGMVDENWEVYVIDDPNNQNAFVLPGGKVFVFSGILRLTRNDSGLAAVLGHEIAHNLADHAAERMSSSVGTNFLMWPIIILSAPFGGLPLLLQIFGWGVADIAFGMPMNRRQESEADYIGLMMMAEACYDPREAVNFWTRMEQAQQMQPPEWLSTHPSNESRIKKMQEWLPKALDKAAESDCANTTAFADIFRQALRRGFVIEA